MHASTGRYLCTLLCIILFLLCLVLPCYFRFQRWGPSIAGLCFIPLLPLYLDHPVEQAIEQGFKRFGPWAKSSKEKDL
ncbi:hypothetical protein EON64_13550 [archaeon]|nr:MAG: hypothetical protein EON64_13550 [archaeon]